MNNNLCVCCGDIIPEGRQVCPVCEMKNAAAARAETRKKIKSAYNQEYNKKNIIQKLITFNRNNPDDMKMLDFLKTQGNAAGYIKKLIANDIMERGCYRNERIIAETRVLNEIQARFIGRDGSCGFRKGKIYELWLSKTDGKYFISRRNLSATAIPYDTAEAVAKNWEIL